MYFVLQNFNHPKQSYLYNIRNVRGKATTFVDLLLAIQLPDSYTRGFSVQNKANYLNGVQNLATGLKRYFERITGVPQRTLVLDFPRHHNEHGYERRPNTTRASGAASSGSVILHTKHSRSLASTAGAAQRARAAPVPASLNKLQALSAAASEALVANNATSATALSSATSAAAASTGAAATASTSTSTSAATTISSLATTSFASTLMNEGVSLLDHFGRLSPNNMAASSANQHNEDNENDRDSDNGLNFDDFDDRDEDEENIDDDLELDHEEDAQELRTAKRHRGSDDHTGYRSGREPASSEQRQVRNSGPTHGEHSQAPPPSYSQPLPPMVTSHGQSAQYSQRDPAPYQAQLSQAAPASQYQDHQYQYGQTGGAGTVAYLGGAPVNPQYNTYVQYQPPPPATSQFFDPGSGHRSIAPAPTTSDHNNLVFMLQAQVTDLNTKLQMRELQHQTALEGERLKHEQEKCAHERTLNALKAQHEQEKMHWAADREQMMRQLSMNQHANASAYQRAMKNIRENAEMIVKLT